MIARMRQIGPGALVTAAFIGPGTVTACTLAGATNGYALLWALLFATVATIALRGEGAIATAKNRKVRTKPRLFLAQARYGT